MQSPVRALHALMFSGEWEFEFMLPLMVSLYVPLFKAFDLDKDSVLEGLGRFKSSAWSSEYIMPSVERLIVKLSEIYLSYTLASGGSAFGLATEVYLVATKAEGLLPLVVWFPEECVTDMLPSPIIFSLTD